MKKILILSPSSTDGTSFYRGVAPFAALAKEGQIGYDFMHAHIPVDWDIVCQYDIVFMQRPYNLQDVYNGILIKQMGKKLIVDYDDNLFELPLDNPTYNVYMDEQIHKNIVFFLNNANAILCSTEYLKNYLSALTPNKNFHVVPNALNDSIFKLQPEPSMKGGVIWRGSPTHTRDLYHVKDEMIEIGNKNPLSFIGMKPMFITDNIVNQNYMHIDYTSLIAYYSVLQNRTWKIGVVPLHDNPFNRSKSNISWIEYTYAGAVTIAPDYDEWIRPGILNYSSPSQLSDWVDALITNPELIASAYNESKSYIEENLLLSKVNVMRKEIIEKL